LGHIEIPKHCISCGGALLRAASDDHHGAPLYCSSCGRRIYLDPKTAVATVIDYQGRIILLKRAQRDIAHGKWILPGGHVDRGELVPRAATREAREETGLEISINGLLGVYSYEGNPIVLIVYWAQASGGELLPGREALELTAFQPDDLPWDQLGYRSTGDALRDYLKLKGIDQAVNG
jgi:ADP-ribose pyrophosphatase YjhB (NUDIX family)